MDEKSILILVFGLLGYIASFLFGYFVHKSRNSGLGVDPKVLDSAERGIEDAESRAENLSDRVGESQERIETVLGESDAVEDLFLKYARESEERAKN